MMNHNWGSVNEEKSQDFISYFAGTLWEEQRAFTLLMSGSDFYRAGYQHLSASLTLSTISALVLSLTQRWGVAVPHKSAIP